MYRNLLLIFASAVVLALVLIWRPWEFDNDPPPSIYDRLPESDIIGMTNLLDLSGSLSETMFYFKLPFRDLISPDFILSQGKNYGLDVQAPVYFFMSEEDFVPVDLGVMLSVKDSSKVHFGIENLQKVIDIEAFILMDATVYTSREDKIYMTYGDDWMLIYQGEDFPTVMKSVISAKHNEISPRWRSFINQHAETSYPLVASIASEHLEEYGIASSFVALSNDSTNFIFNTSITQIDSLSFQTKPAGPAYAPQNFTKHLVNLHFDVAALRRRPKDPVYQLLRKVGSKISFPLEKFMDAWEGDVAFRQGGYEMITQRYIESELDENFNVTEVTKYRNEKVSAFSLYLSMNANNTSFIEQLSQKGILTENEHKYRLLFSPPLNMRMSDTSLIFHTSRHRPNLNLDSTNRIMWTFDYIPVEFFVDSTSTKTAYGRVKVPLRKLIEDRLP